MGLADDLYDIGSKINEIKEANESVSVILTFNEIPAGYDYSIIVNVPNVPQMRTSSLLASDVISFLDVILNNT